MFCHLRLAAGEAGLNSCRSVGEWEGNSEFCVTSVVARPRHWVDIFSSASKIFCQNCQGAQDHLAGMVKYHCPRMTLLFILIYYCQDFCPVAQKFQLFIFKGTGRTLFRLLCSGYVCSIRMVARLVSE